MPDENPDTRQHKLAIAIMQTIFDESLTEIDGEPTAVIRPHEADWNRWLGGSYDDVVAFQRPYFANQMTVRRPMFPTRKKRADR